MLAPLLCPDEPTTAQDMIEAAVVEALAELSEGGADDAQEASTTELKAVNKSPLQENPMYPLPLLPAVQVEKKIIHVLRCGEIR